MVLPVWLTSRPEFADLDEILVSESVFRGGARTFNFREKPDLAKVVELLIKKYASFDEQVAAYALVHRFEAGEKILDANEEVRNFNLLVKGDLEISRRKFSGPQLIEGIFEYSPDYLRVSSTPVYYRKSIIAKSRVLLLRWPLRLVKTVSVQDKGLFQSTDAAGGGQGEREKTAGLKMHEFYERMKNFVHRKNHVNNFHVTPNILLEHTNFTTAFKFLVTAFPELEKTRIDRLANQGETIKVRAKTVIVSEGQLLVHCYGIMAGEARISDSSATRPSTRASERSENSRSSTKSTATRKIKPLGWIGTLASETVDFGAMASHADCTVFKIPTKALEATIGRERLRHILAN